MGGWWVPAPLFLMTIHQANKVGYALRVALEVLFKNCASPDSQDKVAVSFQGSVYVKSSKTRSFLFHVKAPKMLAWDTAELTSEVQRIMPNVRVMEQFVFFFSRSITLTAKELGKTGTYNIDFVQVTP